MRRCGDGREGDDALMEEFFEKGTLPVEDLMKGLRTPSGQANLSVMLSSAPHMAARRCSTCSADVFSDPAKRGVAVAIARWQQGNEVHRKTSEHRAGSIFVYKRWRSLFQGVSAISR